jgi:3-methyl-2-oxobutanoate hydroxymethyltransferase
MKGVLEFAQAKAQGQKLVMVTAYDYPSAYFAQKAGVDLILVGDSVGMVVLGHDSTVPVTMDDMVRHTRAVRRGAPDTFILGDLPFWSTSSVACAVERAGRLVQEGGCHAVKLEGGRSITAHVEAIVRAGVPVCGHIGLTPQSATALGGFRVQGKTAAQARALLEDAQALEAAGAFMLVLECIPTPLARVITERLRIPTIGIGAGPHCDGQVLVWHDLLGMYPRQTPKFVRRYADLGALATKGIAAFADQVRHGAFPEADQGFAMDEEELDRALTPLA